MSMGSILGPTMAAFALDMIECKFTDFNGVKPTFLFRYVDDYLAFFSRKDEAEKFLQFLNNLHSSLKFTVEYENDGSIKFLDTKITKVHSDGECTFEVTYQLKDTNTGIFTPNCSYAPARYKTAAMRTLLLSEAY